VYNEGDLLRDTAHQAVSAPIHIAGSAFREVTHVMFDPNADALQVMTAPVTGAAKAALEELQRTTANLATYAVALPFRAVGAAMRMADGREHNGPEMNR
jgi:hypothetical protein